MAKNECNMTDVYRILHNSLKIRFRMGLFEPSIDDQPYWHIPLSAVNTPATQAYNYLATQESMVLLRNANGVLPLTPGQKTIALIGPHYQAQAALVGNYLGQICPDTDDTSCLTTPLQVSSGKRKSRA